MDHSQNAAVVFNKLAQHYQSKFMDVSAYARELDQFAGLLPDAARVLDIACGPGNITQYILNKKPGIHMLGTDLAPNMIALARLNCPGAEFAVMDCRSISSIAGNFDGIIAGFCMPYLNSQEAAKLLEDMANLLTHEGLLYLSTIEGDHHNSGIQKGSTGDEVFMHYYSLADIEPWLAAAQLQVVAVSRVSVADNPHQDTDLVIIAKKVSTLAISTSAT